MQVWFVILRVLLEVGEGFVIIIFIIGFDGCLDVWVCFDCSKIWFVGKFVLECFLWRFQVLKFIGDVVGGWVLYEGYVMVIDVFFECFFIFRDMVLLCKEFWKFIVQFNICFEGLDVQFLEYEVLVVGFI